MQAGESFRGLFPKHLDLKDTVSADGELILLQDVFLSLSRIRVMSCCLFMLMSHGL